jgi:8-oxo-dGTP diphosphatase
MTLNAGSPVPVVRLIIPNKEGKVLILKRTHTSHSEGSWCLPGGKIDYGQTAEQAVAKELKEETSLVCMSSHFLFYQDSLAKFEGDMHCINLYFECTVSGDIHLNEESGEYAWIGADDINKYDIAFRNDEGLTRYLRESIKEGK